MGAGNSKSKAYRDRSSDVLNSSLQDRLVQRSSSKSIHDKYRVANAHILASGASTHICHASSKTYFRKTSQSFDEEDEKPGRGNVAIKVYDGTSANPPNLAREAELLQQCDHPNIVKLYEVIGGHREGGGSGSSKNSFKPPSLVLELCTGGNVMGRVPYGSEETVAQIVRQVASAVAYLHAKAIVHRSVNARNVLFESKDGNDVKLIDFGSAAQLETMAIPGRTEKAFKMLSETTGSLDSMAPEVVEAKTKYGPACDVWSIGVLAYTLLQDGKRPFEGTTAEEFKQKILNGTVDYTDWKHSDLAKKFIQNCFERDQSKRWSAASALQSNWIKIKGSGSTGGKSEADEALSASLKVPTSSTSSATKILPTDVVSCLQLYRYSNPIKRIALNALAHKTPPTSKIRDVFKKLDVTHSSTLTKMEFKHGLQHTGNSEEELSEMFRIMDVNGNGEILYTEFLAATLEAEGELSDAQLREAFDHMDVDKSGSISKSDLKALLGKSDHAKSLLAECLEYLDSSSSTSSSYSSSSSSSKSSKSKKKGMANKLNRKNKKATMDFDEFEQLFDHGFETNLIQRGMPAITETSLNEAQLESLREGGLLSESKSFGSTEMQA